MRGWAKVKVRMHSSFCKSPMGASICGCRSLAMAAKASLTRGLKTVEAKIFWVRVRLICLMALIKTLWGRIVTAWLSPEVSTLSL